MYTLIYWTCGRNSVSHTTVPRHLLLFRTVRILNLFSIGVARVDVWGKASSKAMHQPYCLTEDLVNSP